MFPKYTRDANPTVIERVRVRDRYCQMCGKPTVDVHQITSRGSGGPDSDENCIGLCREHHNMAHTGEIPRSEMRGVLADKYGFEYPEEDL